VSVQVRLPASLAEAAGCERRLRLDMGAGTLADALDEMVRRAPALERRLRDEAGVLRRYVNVYVDGSDVRRGQGLTTALDDGALVEVLASIAGG